MKKLVSIVLLFSLILSLCPAMAAALTLPDPVTVCGGAIVFEANHDNEHALCRLYSVTGDTAAQQIAPYLTALLQIPQLQLAQSFAENYGDYSGMYYVFNLAEGSCQTFAIGDKINNAAAVLYYDYGGNYAGHNIYVYCSNDFTISSGSAAQTPAVPTTSSSGTQKKTGYTLAGSLILQDPITFSDGLAEFRHDYDKSSHLQKEYRFDKNKIQRLRKPAQGRSLTQIPGRDSKRRKHLPLLRSGLRLRLLHFLCCILRQPDHTHQLHCCTV